jgi:uncharacterized protein YfaS (alpha-2-macroglobulin family)
LYVVALAVLAMLAFAAFRPPSNATAQNAAPAAQPIAITPKPFFSLTSNRTYGTNGSARVWLNYQNIDEIDVRVYKVKDPAKFFRQLSDPHQMGEDEKPEDLQRPQVLESLADVKDYIYDGIRDYVRTQISTRVRRELNHKLGRDVDSSRKPLNVSDYARVPLLNPDQLVTSWRERLPSLDSDDDRRQIVLGKKEPGVYLVEAVNGGLRAYTMAIVSDLVMVNKTTPEGDALVYAVNRRSGAPQPNVNVELISKSQTVNTGKTDGNGMYQVHVAKGVKPVRAEGAAEGEDEDASGYIVMASDRDQFAISDLDSYYFSQFANGEEDDNNLTGYIYTDRPVYRPEHKVNFRGILRRLRSSGYEVVTGKVNVTVTDPDDVKLFDRELQLNSHGTFSGDVDIPAKAKLGSYTIKATVGEATAYSYFEVDEYKKPEYKVKVTPAKDFVQVGEKTRFTIDAHYFFGSPVTKAEVKYYIYRSSYYGYWWGNDDDSEQFGIEGETPEGTDDGYYGYGEDQVVEGEGTLNAQGQLVVDFEVPNPDKDQGRWDSRYRLEAKVTDSGRREISGAGSFVGTRGEINASAYTSRYVYFQGDKAQVQVRTADYHGKPVTASVTLKFLDVTWKTVKKKYDDGTEYDTYERNERVISTADVTTNERGEAVYEYPVNGPGYVEINTTVHAGGKDYASGNGYIWVASSSKDFAGSYAYQDYGSITLIPDKKSYQVGETAHVLALLPTDDARLLVTTELRSVLTAKQITATGRSVMLDVPIEARYAPNVYLNVTFVKNNEMYSQDQVLIVPARDKMINLSLLPNKKEYKPRETASYTVQARDLAGNPVAGAEVSLGVVDEAIYSIQPDITPNIRTEFYGKRYNQVDTNLSVTYRFVGFAGDQPIRIAKNKPSYELADFKADNPLADPTIRRDFKDTAFWQPDVITGADGKAVVEVKLPDNLTTWRATARAVTEDTRVGSTTDKVIARKDLIMRLETPRFVTAGDAVTISGVVHNYLKNKAKVQISLQLTGAQLNSAPSEQVLIPVNGEHRTDWQITAPQQSGEMILLARAQSDKESDAVEIPLTVLPRGLEQKQAESTVISQDEGTQSYTFTVPASADANARELRIEAAPSVAASLFGALDYLTAYPYGCTEQTMSSFLPNVIVTQALKDVQTARIGDQNNLALKVQKGMDRLYSYQHDDGGWGWWKDDETDPFMTAYVVDGLSLAQKAGYSPDPSSIERGRNKLKEMLDSSKNEKGTPISIEDRAYMIYALNASGEADAKYSEGAFTDRARLQPYGRALLALTLADRNDPRAAQVAAEIEQSAAAGGTNGWVSERRPMLDFHEDNSTEATALSVKALARIKPDSPVLPAAARWLTTHRTNGYYWDSTKQTAFAIYGLTDYLKVSKELSPDYQLEVYVNNEQVVNEHVTAADAIAAKSYVIERKGAQLGLNSEVRVVKRGAGMLYFSAAQSYFSNEQTIAAKGSADLSITRQYYRLRVTPNADGTSSWKVLPLTGQLRTGDLIVSKLHITGKKGMYVMVEDPIPAGAEQVKNVSGIDLDYSTGRWSDWYSSREFRDAKSVFFLVYFDGDTTLQYAMRVQVPGAFNVIPARAELMYTPQINANTASADVNIFDKPAAGSRGSGAGSRGRTQ